MCSEFSVQLRLGLASSFTCGLGGMKFIGEEQRKLEVQLSYF